jgi:hypothetical protein
MRRLLKFGVKRVLLALNLDVRRIGGDAQSLCHFADADPLTFQYLADLKIAAVRAIDIAQARAGIMGFSYDAQTAHPLVRAFRAARHVVPGAEAVRSILSEYYSSVQPASALEIVSLAGDEAPGLVHVPLHSWVMPWTERSPEETAARRRTCLEEEGFALRRRVSIEDGATLFGPASAAKIDLEVARVTGLARSIGTKGFRPDPAHPVEVLGLRSGPEYRWLVVQGQHRLAACAAFDIPHAEARIVRIIRREDVEYWPHVVTGTFTVTGALQCFDRLFSGTAGGCAAQWLKLGGGQPAKKLENVTAS